MDAESVRYESEGLFSTTRVSPELIGKLEPLPGQVDTIAVGKSKPIEGPFNFTRWKDPPHVALANLRDDPTAALRFTRTYGVMSLRYKGEPMSFPLRDMFRSRDELRLAWEEPKATMFFWWLESYAGLPATLHVRRSGLETEVADLRTLIHVMFSRDYWDGRVKKCANPGCPAPYFLTVRRGQKYCSQQCAVLINVRQFRARQAGLKSKGVK